MSAYRESERPREERPVSWRVADAAKAVGAWLGMLWPFILGAVVIAGGVWLAWRTTSEHSECVAECRATHQVDTADVTAGRCFCALKPGTWETPPGEWVEAWPEQGSRARVR